MKSRYSPMEQKDTVYRWLIGDGGRRQSEASMEVSAMSPKKLRSLHRNIKILLEDGQLEKVQEEKRWVIRAKKK